MKKRGLVLGSQIAGLSGVESDTARVSELLDGQGFAVTLCTGAQATRAGILEAYRQLISDCGPDDAAVLYYSGHGHYAVSREAVPGQPRVFQGICPTDYEDSTEADYLGICSWELSIQLRRLTARTKNVAVILDCCHSSQLSRDGAAHDAIPRALPHPLYLASFGPHIAALRGLYPGELDSLDLLGNPDAVRLVACGQAESAFEYTNAKGRRTGAFTEALVDTLAEVGNASISWEAVGQAVRERVLRGFPSQRPEIEGPLRRRLFSLGEADNLGIVPIFTTATGLRLRAGRLHGVSDGDVYAVMPVAAQTYIPAKAIALVIVTSAAATTAAAQLQGAWLNGYETLPDDAVAIPHTLVARKRAISLIAPDAARGALEAAITRTATLRVAAADDADPAIATLRLVDDSLTIEDVRGPVFPAARYPDELEPTVGNLKNLGVAQALRELEGAHGVAEGSEIELELGVVEAAGPRALPDRGASLGLGDKIYARIRSRAFRTLYAHLFNLGVRGKVTLLSKFAPSGIALDKGEEFVLGTRPGTQELVGLPLFWPTGLPMDGFPRIDELVVIVTTSRVSLAGLETKEFITRATRGSGSRLQDLLGQLQDGLTRDADPALPLDDYLVKRLSYYLHPRTGRIGDVDFEIDENRHLESSTRSAGAWIEGGAAVEPAERGVPQPATISIRLDELVVDKDRPLFAADVRVDALICTRSATSDSAYRVATMQFKGIKSGERLPVERPPLFLGPVRDFVDLCLWISRDTDETLQLADLFAKQTASAELRDAESALLATAGSLAAPWVTAVGASAVLARIAYELILRAAGKTIGLYRTSYLAQEQFGVGRHPVAGLYRAQDFAFSLLIDTVAKH